MARLFATVVALLTIGCCSSVYRPFFSYAVGTTVERDRIPVGLHEGKIAFEWDVTRSNMELSVHNQSTSSIQIQWPSALFIDSVGARHALEPKRQPQQVDPGQTRRESIYPEGFAFGLGRWAVRSFDPGVPENVSLDKKAAAAFGRAHVGDKAKIVLPVTVQGVVRTYVFTVRTVRYKLVHLCVT